MCPSKLKEALAGRKPRPLIRVLFLYGIRIMPGRRAFSEGGSQGFIHIQAAMVLSPFGFFGGQMKGVFGQPARIIDFDPARQGCAIWKGRA